jgi:hypothetical protein
VYIFFTGVPWSLVVLIQGEGTGGAHLAVEDCHEYQYEYRYTDTAAGSGSGLRNQLVWCRIQPTQNLFTVCNFQTAKQLVTGGSDAIVGLWDCGSTLTLQTRSLLLLLLLPWFVPPPLRDASSLFTRTAFSHDSQLLAIATEEDGIDVADAASGASVGL